MVAGDGWPPSVSVRTMLYLSTVHCAAAVGASQQIITPVSVVVSTLTLVGAPGVVQEGGGGGGGGGVGSTHSPLGSQVGNSAGQSRSERHSGTHWYDDVSQNGLSPPQDELSTHSTQV